MSNSRSINNLLVVGLILLITATLLVIENNEDAPLEQADLIEFDDQAIWERAYEDVRSAEEYPAFDEEQIIKVFDEDNNLIKSMTLMAGDEIIDDDFRKLINQSTLLAEYKSSKVYRLK